MKPLDDLKQLWAFLGEADRKINSLNVRVNSILKPQMPKGRQLPFFQEKTFSFALDDFEVKESAIVLSAGQVTTVTRLSWAISLGRTANVLSGIGLRTSGNVAILANSTGAIDQSAVHLFDFEWSLSIGSTERRYTNGRGIKGFNSRQSLGDPENPSWLLFSDKNPLDLATNEFLNFRVRPTLYNMDPDYRAGGGGEDVSLRFFVHIKAEGYRTYGY